MVGKTKQEDNDSCLPMEVWVRVFSFLSGPDLFNCEGVCGDWQDEVQFMVRSGKVTRRGFKCQRLTDEPQGYTEHRKKMWDSLSLMADKKVLLVGVILNITHPQPVPAKPVSFSITPSPTQCNPGLWVTTLPQKNNSYFAPQHRLGSTLPLVRPPYVLMPDPCRTPSALLMLLQS